MCAGQRRLTAISSDDDDDEEEHNPSSARVSPETHILDQDENCVRLWKLPAKLQSAAIPEGTAVPQHAAANGVSKDAEVSAVREAADAAVAVAADEVKTRDFEDLDIRI